VQVDVRDQASMAHLVAAAEQAFGPPSVMIANAGIVPNASVLDMDVSEWDAAIETNLRGVFLSCQAAARSMVAHGTRGRIVTISSVAHSIGRLNRSTDGIYRGCLLMRLRRRPTGTLLTWVDVWW